MQVFQQEKRNTWGRIKLWQSVVCWQGKVKAIKQSCPWFRHDRHFKEQEACGVWYHSKAWRIKNPQKSKGRKTGIKWENGANICHCKLFMSTVFLHGHSDNLGRALSGSQHLTAYARLVAPEGRAFLFGISWIVELARSPGRSAWLHHCALLRDVWRPELYS